MKSKEEIEQLAKQLCGIPIDLIINEEERYYKNLQKYDGIILGYTQCQEDMADNSKVTRFEVIDENGRVYTKHNCTIELSYQDDNRTLKVFIKSNKQD
jgi:hypothetical protein